MSRRIKVMFDVDGVLADFVQGFTRTARAMGYGNPVVRTSEHRQWDEFPGLTEAQVKRVWAMIEREDEVFWEQLEPLITPVEAQEVCDLAEGGAATVYFVTHRRTKRAQEATRTWLQVVCGIAHPTVLISAHKGLIAAGLEADFAIDDKAGNAVFVQYFSRRTASYLLDRPYNQFPSTTLGTGVKRVSTVGEFLRDIQAVCHGHSRAEDQ